MSRVFVIVLLLCAHFCSAQFNSINGSYVKSYFTDTREIIKEPFSFDKKDVANITMAAGGTAFLMIYDEKLNNFAGRNSNKTLHNVSKHILSPFGNGFYTLPLLGVVYLGGILGENKYHQQMALLGLKTWVVAAGEATIIKMAIQRDRPNENMPPDAWQYAGPFDKFSDDGSFVSRHATTSFAVATIFAEGYKSRNKWVPIVAYSLASLVTVTRVYDQKHWTSDAFAGACLGYVTGRFMYKINTRKPK